MNSGRWLGTNQAPAFLDVRDEALQWDMEDSRSHKPRVVRSSHVQKTVAHQEKQLAELAKTLAELTSAVSQLGRLNHDTGSLSTKPDPSLSSHPMVSLSVSSVEVWATLQGNAHRLEGAKLL